MTWLRDSFDPTESKKFMINNRYRLRDGDDTKLQTLGEIKKNSKIGGPIIGVDSLKRNQRGPIVVLVID